MADLNEKLNGLVIDPNTVESIEVTHTDSDVYNRSRFSATQIVDQINDDSYVVKESLINLLRHYKSLQAKKAAPTNNNGAQNLDSFIILEKEKKLVSRIKWLLVNRSSEGGSNDSENAPDMDHLSDNHKHDQEEDEEQLPKNLIVTSVPVEVFANLDIRLAKYSFFFTNLILKLD
jgi:hypothetical protein